MTQDTNKRSRGLEGYTKICTQPNPPLDNLHDQVALPFSENWM